MSISDTTREPQATPAPPEPWRPLAVYPSAGAGLYRVASDNTPDRYYMVDAIARTCTCPHYRHRLGGARVTSSALTPQEVLMCKHLEAVDQTPACPRCRRHPVMVDGLCARCKLAALKAADEALAVRPMQGAGLRSLRDDWYDTYTLPAVAQGAGR